MDNIFIKLLKQGFLYCHILNPGFLEQSLNKYFSGVCTFKVDSDYHVKMYDESNFVKNFDFVIENDIIKDIKLHI